MGDVAKPPPAGRPPSQPPSRSAARPVDLKLLSAERKQREIQALAPRLKSGAEDAVLNALALAREASSDFRRLDRFFKYKLGIVGAWILLSALTLAVVSTRSEKVANDLGARLVVGTVLDHPVYMVKNEGNELWKDVVVVVNHRYRAAASEVAPGKELTFGPRQLLGENGLAAPPNLELTDFELRTARGRASLVERGQFR